MTRTRHPLQRFSALLHLGGAVAQLGERLVRNEEVRGSTPLGSTSLLAAKAARRSVSEGGLGPDHHPPAPPSMSPSVPESILRHQPFVLYWSARACAAMGYQMLGVAVAWQMYALTGSAF